MEVKLTVTVLYAGEPPFVQEFAAAADITVVKMQALTAFGLDHSAARKYVLKQDGIIVADHVKVGTLGQDAVTLTLSLQGEVEKG